MKNSKFAIAFVCRILKESMKAKFFNPRNPWLYSLLSLLKEIYDIQMATGIGPQDNLMEIEALFVTLGAQDIKPNGLLTPAHIYINQTAKRELERFYTKIRLIIPSSIVDTSIPAVEESKSREAQMSQIS